MSRPSATVEAVVAACDRAASDTQFSGVVRVDLEDGTTVDRCYGFADRRWEIPFKPDTRLGAASLAKGFTGLTAMALVESGALTLETTARSILESDLPLIDDAVTVEHLLAHRSGIGDYLDEEAQSDITDYVMPVPVHQLDSTEAYVRALDGHPQVSPPGERAVYNNGGFVVLALLIERSSGVPYEQLVDALVCVPAGLTATGFLRSDELPADVAMGYLDVDGLRTNALHLPVLGSGDGGIYTTTADVRQLWLAFFAGRIVSLPTVELMTQPRSELEDLRYGLGFWLAREGPMVKLEGYDAGVSFRSWHDPTNSQTYTVMSNTADGAWPVCRALSEILGPP